jgi:hypothetical protein
MTGLVRKAAVLAACGMLGATVAFAGVPSAGNSTIPARINLVGYNVGSGLADVTAAGAVVSVTVRDLANNPIPNSSVVLDFTGVLSDTRIDDSQAYYAGLTANCGSHSVIALTNGSGVATLAVVGGGLAAAGPAHAAGAAKVWADGVLLGPLSVGTYDENGAAGVGGADLSRFLADFVAGTHPDRSDFNGAAGVGGADLSLWLAVFVSGASNTSSSSYCL